MGRKRFVWFWLAAIILVVAASGVALANGIHGDQARALKYGGPFEYFKAGAVHMLTG